MVYKMGYGIKNSLIRVRQLLCLSSAVKYGSISKAAEKNNMKQSNLSVQIRQLEEELGEVLISRIHNGVKITEAGNEVYSIACNLENIINRSYNLNIKAFRVSGDIRLWTTDGLGIGYVSDCFSEFYGKYPNVNIEVLCSQDRPKPDQFDMAMIYEEPKDNSLKIIKCYDLKFSFFASKTYLSRFGYPKSIKDVQENHRVCNKSNYSEVWKKWDMFISDVKNISASTNSSTMLLQLIKDGIGIGFLPKGIASKEHELIELSNLNLNLSHKYWLVVRNEVKDIDKIKALTKFIKDVSDQL